MRTARAPAPGADTAAEGLPVNLTAGLAVAPPVLPDHMGGAPAHPVGEEGGDTDRPRQPFTVRGTALQALLRRRGLLAVLADRQPQSPVQHAADVGGEVSLFRDGRLLHAPATRAVQRSPDAGLPSSVPAGAGTGRSITASTGRVPGTSPHRVPAAAAEIAGRAIRPTDSPVPAAPARTPTPLMGHGRATRAMFATATPMGRIVKAALAMLAGSQRSARAMHAARPVTPTPAGPALSGAHNRTTGSPSADRGRPTTARSRGSALGAPGGPAGKAVSVTGDAVVLSLRPGASKEGSPMVDIDRALAVRAVSTDAVDNRSGVSTRVASSLPPPAGGHGRPPVLSGLAFDPLSRLGPGPAVADVSGAETSGDEPTVSPVSRRRGARTAAAVRPAHLGSSHRVVRETNTITAEPTPDVSPTFRPPARSAARGTALEGLRQALRHIGDQTVATTPTAVNRTTTDGRARSSARTAVRGRGWRAGARPGGLTPPPLTGGRGLGPPQSEPAREPRGEMGDRSVHAVEWAAARAPSGADPAPEVTATRASHPVFRSVVEAAAGLKPGSSVTLRLADTPFGQLRMTIHRRGDTVRVTIVTHSDRSGAGLRRAQSALARVLEARGLQLGSMRIDVAGASSSPAVAASPAPVSSDAGSAAQQQQASAGPPPGHAQGETRENTPRHPRATPREPSATMGPTPSTAGAATPGTALQLDLRV